MLDVMDRCLNTMMSDYYKTQNIEASRIVALHLKMAFFRDRQ